MVRIFISYRRDDSAGQAGRLYDHLSKRFGQRAVFRDLDAIPPGVDFVATIQRAVGSCDVLLALIGKTWLTNTDAEGNRRLENPQDFVRLEIAAALDRNVAVIPVLANSATMPGEQQLPPQLAPLARRNAHELSERRWQYDVDQLESVIGNLPRRRPGGGNAAGWGPNATERRVSRRALLVGAGGIVTVGGVALLLPRRVQPTVATAPPVPPVGGIPASAATATATKLPLEPSRGAAVGTTVVPPVATTPPAKTPVITSPSPVLTPLAITMRDSAIGLAPTSVKAGMVTFTIKNNGPSAHQAQVSGEGVTKLSEKLQAQESDSFTLGLKPGTYTLICVVPGHQQSGMKATLTVV